MKWLMLFFHGGVSIFMVATAMANQSLPAGHMLDQLKLTQSGSDSILHISGTFTPSQFSDIQIISKKNSGISNIIIPNSFVNNLNLPKMLKFPNGRLLESTEIHEEVRKTEKGSVFFQVGLQLNTSEAVRIFFDKSQSNSRKMIFVIRSQKEEKPSVTAPKMVANPMSDAPKKMEEIKEESTTVEAAMPSKNKMGQGAFSGRPTSQGMPAKFSVREPDKVLLHPVSAMMLYQRPVRLQLSVLNASHQRDGAQRLAVLLERHQRHNLENRVGMKLEITNISSVREAMILPKTKIYFRPNFLDAALALSQLIPGEQLVEQMSLDRRGKLGIDVEIYVGENFE